MVPKIGDRVTFIGARAGGVLSGTYPDPDFAEPLATVADLASKADTTHQHAASALTSGALAIGRIPTSTTATATAVPRADDPRLTGPRPWSQYTASSATPTTGQVPTWNGTVYAPATPPSALPAPDATTTQKGLIQLSGDLGGTSASPKVVVRGPIGGHLAAPNTTGSVTLNAATGNSFYVSATGNISINPPTNPTDGQRVMIEVFASGAARTTTIAAAVATVSGINRTLSIAAGKIAVVELLYTARTAKWITQLAVVEA